MEINFKQMDLYNKIKDLSKEYHKTIINIRRHIHMHPELSFKEFETSKYIFNILNKEGLNPKIIVDTGVYVKIVGKKSKSNKCIVLRADIDALPITEENDVEYKSKNKGIMHACGHDVHAASLIGVAKILKSLIQYFSGIIILIFQPAEEMLPGGAKKILDSKILSNLKPNFILGMHVDPELNIGEVGFCPNNFFASSDILKLIIKGKGGHAAAPNTVIDPIVITSNIILTLQQLISREKPLNIPTVLSFGRIEGLGKNNVIPDLVTLGGVFRTLNDNWRVKALERIKNIAQNVAVAMRATCEIKIKNGYPSLKNNEKLTFKCMKFAKNYLNEEKILQVSPKLYAEDFAYYTKKIPACFYVLGIKNRLKNIEPNLHHSKFDIDEEALKISMGLMTSLAIDLIKEV